METYTTMVPKSKHGAGKAFGKPLAMAVGALVIAAAAFFGGIAYQKHHGGANASGHGPLAGIQSGGFGGGRFARRSGGFGTVTAASSSSITVQNQRSGASTTYTINSSTQVSDNGASASVTAIQNGDTVLVQTSGMGSATATRIEINPSLGGVGAGSSQSTGVVGNGSNTNNAGSANVN